MGNRTFYLCPHCKEKQIFPNYIGEDSENRGKIISCNDCGEVFNTLDSKRVDISGREKEEVTVSVLNEEEIESLISRGIIRKADLEFFRKLHRKKGE